MVLGITLLGNLESIKGEVCNRGPHTSHLTTTRNYFTPEWIKLSTGPFQYLLHTGLQNYLIRQ